MQLELGQTLLAINKILAMTGAPGVSVGIIHHGQTAGTYHFGYCDVENKLQADDGTRYNINTLSKALVSSLVGFEVHEGVLDWASPVKTWLPGFSSAIKEVADGGSIVDLLSHRAGLSSLDDLWMGADNVIYINKSQVLPTFQTLPPAQPFRESLSTTTGATRLLPKPWNRFLDKTSLSCCMTDCLPRSVCHARRQHGYYETRTRPIATAHLKISPSGGCEAGTRGGYGDEGGGGDRVHFHRHVTYCKIFMHETNLQFSSGSDTSAFYPRRECRMLTMNLARPPGVSWKEQGYGLCLGRTQLPGQLGLLSGNAMYGDGPVVGERNSSLIPRHHGYMHDSTSFVYLAPEVESRVVVLQNSMPIVDTANLNRQLVLEALLHVKEPSDYMELSRNYYNIEVNHLATF